jgi:hypothetical protein
MDVLVAEELSQRPKRHVEWRRAVMRHLTMAKYSRCIVAGPEGRGSLNRSSEEHEQIFGTK